MFCSLEARFWPTGLDIDRSLDTSAFIVPDPGRFAEDYLILAP
jgi:hypothetical protein